MGRRELLNRCKRRKADPVVSVASSACWWKSRWAHVTSLRGSNVQKTQTQSPSNDDEVIRFAAAAATVTAPLLFLLLQFSTGALSVAVREPIPNTSAANDGRQSVRRFW
jgi:hypothetical protein